MSNIHSLDAAQQAAAAAQKAAPSLNSGGGGGTSDGMEARLKRLEEDKELRGDLKTLLREMAEIKGRINAMPTTWQMVGLIVAMAVAIFTVVRVTLPI